MSETFPIEEQQLNYPTMRHVTGVVNSDSDADSSTQREQTAKLLCDLENGQIRCHLPYGQPKY